MELSGTRNVSFFVLYASGAYNVRLLIITDVMFCLLNHRCFVYIISLFYWPALMKITYLSFLFSLFLQSCFICIVFLCYVHKFWIHVAAFRSSCLKLFSFCRWNRREHFCRVAPFMRNFASGHYSCGIDSKNKSSESDTGSVEGIGTEYFSFSFKGSSSILVVSPRDEELYFLGKKQDLQLVALPRVLPKQLSC